MHGGTGETPEAVVIEPEVVQPESGGNSPAREGRQYHNHMTDELALLMAQDILAGKSQREIAQKYNYGVNNIHRTVHGARMKRAMQQVLMECGVDKEVIADKIKQLLDCTTTIVATHKGKITDKIEVPDNSNQRATVELVGDWMGISPYKKMHQEGGGPRVIIIGNPVFAQMFYGDEPGAGNALGSDRGSVEGIQSGADGAEDLAVPEARDCD